MFSHLSASLQGLTTIRAFEAQQIFMNDFDSHQVSAHGLKGIRIMVPISHNHLFLVTYKYFFTDHYPLIIGKKKKLYSLFSI